MGINFEVIYRTIETRKEILTKEQMKGYGIRIILNSFGDIEDMNDDTISHMCSNAQYSPENVCMVETAIKTVNMVPLKVVSILVFKNEYCMHMFGMMCGGEKMLTLLN